MTYTPKPGDRVTSPLLVGEWEVVKPAYRKWRVECADGHGAYIPPELLTPVTPPLPPEPAVGSVVRAHGRLWIHDTDHYDWIDGDGESKWSDLATAPDLSPVVPVEDVAEWAQNHGAWMTPSRLANEFRAEFGGWGDD